MRGICSLYANVTVILIWLVYMSGTTIIERLNDSTTIIYVLNQRVLMFGCAYMSKVL